MSIVLITGFSIIILMAINANLIKLYLDEKTKYREFDIYDQSQILFLFIFLGIFCLPFIKQIKKYRKRLYLEKRLDQLKTNKAFTLFQEPKMKIEDIDKEIFSIERLLKLEKLKKKV